MNAEQGWTFYEEYKSALIDFVIVPGGFSEKMLLKQIDKKEADLLSKSCMFQNVEASTPHIFSVFM